MDGLVWIDIGVFILVLTYVFYSWDRGLVSLAAEFIAWTLTAYLLVALWFNGQQWLLENLGLSRHVAGLLAFVMEGLVFQIGLFSLFSWIGRKLKKSYFSGWVASVSLLLIALVNGLITLLFALMVLWQLQLSATINKDIARSFSGGVAIRYYELLY